MTEPQKPQIDASISTQVVGEYSPQQRQEVMILAAKIITSQGQNMRGEADILAARAVVEDSLSRGLAQTGNVWFEPDDDISLVFERGLTLRSRLVQQFQASFFGESNAWIFFDEEEFRQIEKSGKQITALSQDIHVIEEPLREYARRIRLVEGFQNAIFTSPVVSSEVALLRQEAHTQARQHSVFLTPSEMNDKLYRNFLVHAAVFQKAGVTIEPKDVALLLELWDTFEKQQRGTERVTSDMVGLASEIGIDDANAVAAYTQHMIGSFLSYFHNREVHLDTLHITGPFIFHRTHIESEVTEILQDKPSLEMTNSQSLTVTGEQLARAKAFVMANDQFSFDYLDNITADELLLVLNEISNLSSSGQIVRDVLEVPDISVFVEALSYIDRALLLKETGEYVLGYEGKGRKYASEKVEKVVLQGIYEDRIDLREVAQNLPYRFLEKLVTADTLSAEQGYALSVLDDAFWIQVASGIEMQFDQLDDSDFFDSAEITALKKILRAFPDERKEKIIEGLKNVVKLS